MSKHGTLLPIPDDPAIQRAIDDWPQYAAAGATRAHWLGHVESMLRVHYPAASSADLRLTARHIAPFYLAQGHDVP